MRLDWGEVGKTGAGGGVYCSGMRGSARSAVKRGRGGSTESRSTTQKVESPCYRSITIIILGPTSLKWSEVSLTSHALVILPFAAFLRAE